MDFKTLEGKILANRSSIRQIRQCFPPPTFRAIRYLKKPTMLYIVTAQLEILIDNTILSCN